jgi:hypothetical protein
MIRLLYRRIAAGEYFLGSIGTLRAISTSTSLAEVDSLNMGRVASYL